MLPLGRVLLLLLLCVLPASAEPRPEALGPWTVTRLDDRLVHLEFGARPGAPIPVSPYVDPAGFPGRYPGTSELQIRQEDKTLVVTAAGRTLLEVRPTGAGYTLRAPGTRHLLGLGEQFPRDREDPAATSLERVGTPDWMGRERVFWRKGPEPHPFGNTLSRFVGGNVGNASFPVLYGVGDTSWMLFLDDPARQHWDFRAGPGGEWTVETESPDRRLFLAVGPDLRALRRDYMGLVGRPPVPPRAAFGLWVSEYGFEDWAEVEDRLAGLRRERFPVDGFVLDLQWFGGIQEGSPDSRMGSLRWDEARFPDPAGRLRRFRTQDGVGVIPIEEPYISRGLPEHQELARRGYLARQGPAPASPPFEVTDSNWWGVGGMLDPTNPQGRRFWHAWRRQPLVDAGVAGHWIDLGEPECYANGPATPFYHEGRHDQVHNLYAHQWARGLWEGYADHAVARRPFLLSRSGGPGIQRYGAAMWSGDIASNPESLGEHLNAQVNVSLSGIDYYGSDVGGFFREHFPGSPAEMDRLYTRWFAAACAVEVPIRPHTMNLGNRYATSPDRIGHLDSNRENLRWRYRLIPYYYSLAHEATRSGDPLVAPPGFWNPAWESPEALSGRLKMVGADLLVALTADPMAESLALDLPPGDWLDLRTARRLKGRVDLPLMREGRFGLPLLARAGSILPMMPVDAQTMNASGRRLDGRCVQDLVLRVHSGPARGSFLLTEDDGETVAYRTGQVATTRLSRETRPGEEVVVVEPRRGAFPGASTRRALVVELVPPAGARVVGATLDGHPLAVSRRQGLTVVRTPSVDPTRRAEFRFRLATQTGRSRWTPAMGRAARALGVDSPHDRREEDLDEPPGHRGVPALRGEARQQRRGGRRPPAEPAGVG